MSNSPAGEEPMCYDRSCSVFRKLNRPDVIPVLVKLGPKFYCPFFKDHGVTDKPELRIALDTCEREGYIYLVNLDARHQARN